jgi:hypothetical protein
MPNVTNVDAADRRAQKKYFDFIQNGSALKRVARQLVGLIPILMNMALLNHAQLTNITKV